MTPADPIRVLRADFERRTTRYRWAPPEMAHDLELDLGHAIKRHGYDTIRTHFDDWVQDVVDGDARGHLYGFLKRLEQLKPTPKDKHGEASVVLNACGSCGLDFTTLTTEGLCLRCDGEAA